MKTILVPIDFSPVSLRAIPVAASIAERTGGKIVLLHNLSDNVRDLKGGALPPSQEELKIKTDYVKREMSKLTGSGILRPHDVHYDITNGITDAEITKHAFNVRAGLIVMGSHGSSTANGHFVDSVTQKVMRETPCPVLIINNETDEVHWDKILVPASFNENLDDEFSIIFSLAKQLDSTVHLVFINRPDKFKDTPVIRKQMEKVVQRYPEIRFETAVYNHHELETAILEYALEISANWIAMITHDHRHQAKYLISGTETVSYHATVPVLCVPKKKKTHVEVDLTNAQSSG